MGKVDVRALRVHQRASTLMRVKRTPVPPWFNVITEIPPAQALVRPPTVQHSGRIRLHKSRKPSKMFQPRRIVYEEDRMRGAFFADHPWELARPRIVSENDGREARRWDWSKSFEAQRPLNGESVVQRQRWLMQPRTVTGPDGKKTTVPGMRQEEAYDKARKEFYEQRFFNEMEQHVAKEEAMSTGAQFNRSQLEIGMQIESEVFENWKQWATKEVAMVEQSRSAAYTGMDSSDASTSKDDAQSSALDQALSLFSSSKTPKET